ncbi:MAG: hypothetical protein HUJ42_01415 [Malacoplasma sp.]|nr:hypothetical protein [Malacoplasma sp.]
MSWASSTFSTDLFANLYLSVVDANGNYLPSTTVNLQNAIQNTNGIKFAFSSKGLNKSVDSFVATQYAAFQDFIFNQWVQSENPFIINYVDWSYSAPINGLSSVYNKDAYGQTVTGDTIAPSYKFPYFSEKNDNNSLSIIQNFNNFIASAKSGYADSGDQASAIGLTNLNKNKFSSDTSNSYKLITNSSAYSTWTNNLGLASSFLFDTSFTQSSNGNSTAAGINYADRSLLTKTLSTSALGPFDAITSNFVATSADAFKNSTLSASGSSAQTTNNGNNSKSVNYILLDDALVKKILSTNGYSQLNPTTSGTSQSGTTNSTTKYDTSKGLYVIDAFIPSDTNLNNILFARESDAVYALVLDGQSYISKATSLADAKKRAGDIVLYRFLQNKYDSNQGFAIDLSSTLSTFYSDNKDWLIYEYTKQNTNQTLFDLNFVTANQTAKNFFDALCNYLYVSTRYTRIQTYQAAVYGEKYNYSKNYGVNTYSNGIAASYPYAYVKAGSATTGNLTYNKMGYFKALESLQVTNPFVNDTTNFNVDPYANGGLYSIFLQAAKTYSNSLSLAPLTSDFKGFQYSQYILTNDFFVNQAIIAVGSDGNLLSDLVKQEVLTNAINKNAAIVNTASFGYDSYKLTTFNDASTGTSSNVASYLNSALSNTFFNSTFDGSDSKWTQLNQNDFGTSNVYISKNYSVLPTVTYSDFDNYRTGLWTANVINRTANNADSYINFLTEIATIQYLLQDNGAMFLSQLRSKLSTSSSQLSFLVWENSVDKNNDISKEFITSTAAATNNTAATTTTLSDASKLLYGKDGTSVVTNVNNSQASAYIPNDAYATVGSDNNNHNSTFVDSATNSNYYFHVANMVGFQGIQTNTSNNGISDALKNLLFTEPTKLSNQNGLLYGIASTKDHLVNLIKTYSSSQVVTLANTMASLFPNVDFTSVYNSSSVTDMQNALITIVNDTSKIPTNAFSPRNGYINGTKLYGSDTDSVNGLNYGAYVIQLNDADLASTTTFYNYLTSVFNTNDPSKSNSQTQTSGTTTNSNAAKEASEVYWNLVVQLANDSNIQNYAIANLTNNNNKVNVYDVRLNNQLGSRWVLNYKDKSTS